MVNGKLRSRITVAADATDDAIRKLALSDEKIKRTISGKQLTMEPIVVHSPGSKLVNIVVR